MNDLAAIAIAVGVWLAALAVASLAGGPVVAALLHRIQPGFENDGLLRGGTWIGRLERLAIALSILAGHPEAVAVVLAVKGLGRYPELRTEDAEDRSAATERFIVGTLASYLWAAIAGGLAVWGLSLLR
ncbi:MAG: hypothetical protein DIU73_000365 [Actinomycetes bacterium]|nr:MAG: hypothetical protein DIU73_03925 [Actinomycetota bacterium]